MPADRLWVVGKVHDLISCCKNNVLILRRKQYHRIVKGTVSTRELNCSFYYDSFLLLKKMHFVWSIENVNYRTLQLKIKSNFLYIGQNIHFYCHLGVQVAVEIKISVK